MDSNIVKPTSILRHEFVENLTNLINESMLPPFVIEPILAEMYNNVHILSERQLKIDIENYNNMCKTQ